MAYGNNRSGKQARAHFQLAGGTTIRFKHPYLAGQLGSSDSPIDENGNISRRVNFKDVMAFSLLKKR